MKIHTDNSLQEKLAQLEILRPRIGRNLFDNHLDAETQKAKRAWEWGKITDEQYDNLVLEIAHSLADRLVARYAR